MTEAERHIPTANYSVFRNDVDTDNGSACAAKYFATASKKHPASTTAQAACIAQLCKTSGNRRPITLMKSVLEDTEKLDALAKAATSIHAAHMNGPKNSTGTIEPVTPDRIKGTVRQDFLLAEWMMILSDDQLDRILELYPHYQDLNHAGLGRDAETQYRLYAHEMIRTTLESEIGVSSGGRHMTEEII